MSRPATDPSEPDPNPEQDLLIKTFLEKAKKFREELHEFRAQINLKFTEENEKEGKSRSDSPPGKSDEIVAVFKDITKNIGKTICLLLTRENEKWRDREITDGTRRRKQTDSGYSTSSYASTSSARYSDGDLTTISQDTQDPQGFGKFLTVPTQETRIPQVMQIELPLKARADMDNNYQKDKDSKTASNEDQQGGSDFKSHEEKSICKYNKDRLEPIVCHPDGESSTEISPEVEETEDACLIRINEQSREKEKRRGGIFATDDDLEATTNDSINTSGYDTAVESRENECIDPVDDSILEIQNNDNITTSGDDNSVESKETENEGPVDDSILETKTNDSINTSVYDTAVESRENECKDPVNDSILETQDNDSITTNGEDNAVGNKETEGEDHADDSSDSCC